MITLKATRAIPVLRSCKYTTEARVVELVLYGQLDNGAQK